MTLNFNSRDIENARLMADAIYSDFLKKFEENYNRPDRELHNTIMFKSMSDESKKALQENDPETYRLAQKKYGGV